MTNNRKDKQKPERDREDDDHRQMSPAGGEKDGGAREPSRIERRGWRGEGVVGDRHTD